MRKTQGLPLEPAERRGSSVDLNNVGGRRREGSKAKAGPGLWPPSLRSRRHARVCRPSLTLLPKSLQNSPGIDPQLEPQRPSGKWVLSGPLAGSSPVEAPAHPRAGGPELQDGVPARKPLVPAGEGAALSPRVFCCVCEGAVQDCVRREVPDRKPLRVALEDFLTFSFSSSV